MELENLSISFGETVTSNELYRVKFSMLIEYITNNPEIKKRIEAVRSIDDDYFRQEKKKTTLPYFNLGLFKQNIRRNENLESIQFIMFDFDHLTREQYELVFCSLKKDERTFMLFHSASGGCRFKAVFMLEHPVKNCMLYESVYKHYYHELVNDYKVEIDYTPDVQRSCFFSYDESLYLNANCTLIPIVEYTAPGTSNIPEGGEYSDKSLAAEASCFLRHKIDNYSDYMKIGLSLASLGEKGREHFITVCHGHPGYPGDTVEKLDKDFNSFLKSYDENKTRKLKINSFFYLAKQKGFTFPEKSFSYTEMGGAEMLAYYFSHKLKYCRIHKLWYIWDGVRWRTDEVQMINDSVKELIKKLYAKASQMDDPAKRVELLKYIRTCEREKTQKSILRLAEAHKDIRIHADDLNSSKYLFNCLNGTINLATKEIQFEENDSSNLITQTANVKINLKAQCPKWQAFMNKIFRGDAELIEFVQKALGYTLTGFTSEQCIFLMIGNGQNGKSTFVETVQMIMGDYAVKSSFQLVTPQKDGKVRNDIARLKGSRFVVTSEPGEGKKFDESTIKDLTGGDTISARFLFAEEFSFKPMFKLWIYGNHKPVIKETDKGIYRRIRLIPFDYTFREEEKRPQEEILNDFLEEKEGILNWMLEGFRKWKQYGLAPAEKVKAATKEYFDEMDFIQSFIDECCLVDQSEKESLQEVYKYYKLYAKQHGEWEITQRQFSCKLKAKNFNNYRGTSGYTTIKGLRIRSDIKIQYSLGNEGGNYGKCGNYGD